ncbi:MAG TPA: hypothetical protein VMD91_04015 [Candidatus Sulfotelmatobacter sp.]|nr:hypothetical protein [Candidatus Sulfotelmatobacter sp.]
MRAHQYVDAVDLDESDPREDPPQQTTVDGAPRRRVGEALRRQRDPSRFGQREVGDAAGLSVPRRGSRVRSAADVLEIRRGGDKPESDRGTMILREAEKDEAQRTYVPTVVRNGDRVDAIVSRLHVVVDDRDLVVEAIDAPVPDDAAGRSSDFILDEVFEGA